MEWDCGQPPSSRQTGLNVSVLVHSNQGQNQLLYIETSNSISLLVLTNSVWYVFVHLYQRMR